MSDATLDVGGLGPMAREYLEAWVAFDLAAMEADCEAEQRSGTRLECRAARYQARILELERDVQRVVARSLADRRAKAAILLVYEVGRKEDDYEPLIADLTCDLLGVSSVDELGRDAPSIAMEILRRGLV